MTLSNTVGIGHDTSHLHPEVILLVLLVLDVSTCMCIMDVLACGSGHFVSSVCMSVDVSERVLMQSVKKGRSMCCTERVHAYTASTTPSCRFVSVDRKHRQFAKSRNTTGWFNETHLLDLLAGPVELVVKEVPEVLSGRSSAVVESVVIPTVVVVVVCFLL